MSLRGRERSERVKEGGGPPVTSRTGRNAEAAPIFSVVCTYPVLGGRSGSGGSRVALPP